MVKVKLLRPLDGGYVGDVVEYTQADAERLSGYGAVEILAEKPKEKAKK